MAYFPENGLAGVWAASLSQGLSATEGLGLFGKEGLEDYKFILQTIFSGEFVFTLLKLKKISLFCSNKSKFEAAFELILYIFICISNKNYKNTEFITEIAGGGGKKSERALPSRALPPGK